MKLKNLPPRLYNITFHTHTVSGIVISFALYVIFFAGAFTLFRKEFYPWENPAVRQPFMAEIDYDAVLRNLKEKNPLFDLSEDMTISAPSAAHPLMSVSGHLIVKEGEEEEHYHTYYNPHSGELSSRMETTTGATLYRLHFFDQIPYVGRYLSGFVALFFAFAVVTGVMIHWQNILTKFNGFTLKGSRKVFWTNAHTVFGLLGLPFQFMYAITGVYYMLVLLVLLPIVVLVYDGNQAKAIADIVSQPQQAIELREDAPVARHNIPLKDIIADLKKEYPEMKLNYMQLKHYDREDGTLLASLSDGHSFTGDGTITVQLKDGAVVQHLMPGEKTYAQSVLPGIGKLHFATFGGLALKIVYFLLTLFTCFVIISGVLLWKEARNKQSYTPEQKRFHRRVTMVYLAICLGLFPAVAVLFCSELLVPPSGKHSFIVNTIFFVSWLVLTVIGLGARTEARLTSLYLLLGGVSSLAVPLVNGFKTGDWIWTALSKQSYYVAATDIFWMLAGLICLVFGFQQVRRKKDKTADPEALRAAPARV